MLYETLAQPLIFLIMSAGGLAAGFLFDVKNVALAILFQKKKNKLFSRIFSHILMFFACFFALFLYLNLRTNYGEFRNFGLLAFLLSFCLERFFIENFVAIPVAKCYNKIKAKHGRKANRKKQHI